MSPPDGTAQAAISDGIELSVVMPCLNEARTLGACIEAARTAITVAGLQAEIVIADNGSSDDSRAIAERMGARVVAVPTRGYGAALRAGITASHGRYIVMGDADESYDFAAIPRFVEALRGGSDLVMGDRFAGGIQAHAMPWTHRYIGNPILSRVGRLFFRSSVRDFHCGMRGFSRAAFDALELRSNGMEFASEMVAKASLQRLRISEVPVVLRRDGRDRPPHLRTWHDGWRHLRFMLLYSPRWLFLVPGALLAFVGLAVAVWLLPGERHIGRVGFDLSSLLVAAFAVVLGYQLVVFALLAKTYAVREGLHPPSPVLERLYRRIRLEHGALAGVVLALGGMGTVAVAAWRWGHEGFPQLNVETSLRVLIPAVVVATLGVETVFTSFLLSILGVERERNDRREQPRRGPGSGDGSSRP